MYYKFWVSLRKLQTKSQFRHYITIPFFHLLDIRHLRFLLRLHTWFHFSIYSSVIIRNQLWPHPTPGKTIWINLNQSYQRMLPYKFELFKRTGFWEDFLKVFSLYSYVKPPIVDLPCPMIWTSLNLPYMMVLSQKWQVFRMIGFKTVFNVNQGHLGTDRKINSRFRTRAS